MIGGVTLAFLIAWVLTKGIERLPDGFPESALYTLLLLAGIGFGIAFLVKFSNVDDALRWNSAMPAAMQKVH
jgi:4-amino-4-deoxy-L-arabinose transferase-like glycosyltransferase